MPRLFHWEDGRVRPGAVREQRGTTGLPRSVRIRFDLICLAINVLEKAVRRDVWIDPMSQGNNDDESFLYT